MSDVIEQTLYGVIDGVTAPYGVSCRDAMKQTVDGAFKMWDHKNVLDPNHTAKLQLAINYYLTGNSNMYVYCDFNNLYLEISRFADFGNTKQYVKFYSRVLGALISNFGTHRACIKLG